MTTSPVVPARPRRALVVVVVILAVTSVVGGAAATYFWLRDSDDHARLVAAESDAQDAHDGWQGCSDAFDAEFTGWQALNNEALALLRANSALSSAATAGYYAVDYGYVSEAQTAEAEASTDFQAAKTADETAQAANCVAP